MGHDGARLVTVNSVGREISELDQALAATERPAAPADDRLRHAEGGARRVQGHRATTARRSCSTRAPARSWRWRACRPSIRTRSPAGIDAKTWSSLLNDPLRAAAEPRDPGPLFARAPRSRSRSPSPGSRKASSRRSSARSVPAAPTSTADTSSATQGGPHGRIDLRHAIEKSCNVYFYTVGNMLGIDRLHKWASALGLGEMSGIDLPHEIQGIMPSTAWKKRRTGEKWYAGETISVSIGQGQVSVTPVSLAVMMMTVANGGTRHTPHLVRAVDEGKGWMPYPAPTPRSIGPDEALDDRRRARRVVDGGERRGHRRPRPPRGPRRGRKDRDGAGHLASRASSARARTERDLRDHGFFVFFAPAKNPEVAGCRLRRALRARLERRADRQAHDRRRISPRRKASRCRRMCRRRRRRRRPAPDRRRRGGGNAVDRRRGGLKPRPPAVSCHRGPQEGAASAAPPKTDD